MNPASLRAWHTLKPNKTIQHPRQWCVVDTETNIDETPEGVQTHTLKLGVAYYHREPRQDRYPVNETFRFENASSFWDWLLRTCESDRTLLLLGHNLSFDLRILSGWHELQERGFKCTSMYLTQSVFLCLWRRKKLKVKAIDTMNYFRGALQTWAETIGATKVTVDFRSVTKNKLWERCNQDVAIAAALFSHWLRFIADNRFGALASTVSGQAFTAFRHRFLRHKVYIHGHSLALPLERDSYLGGRSECFRIGKYTGQDYYLYDINALYPFVMLTTPVPVRFLQFTRLLGVRDLMRIPSGQGAIADVRIQTNEPAYPCKTDTGTVWPVGTFRTVLAWPELSHALVKRRIRGVYRAATYQMGVIFADYVKALYSLRMQFKMAGNKLWERLVKLMMNSLYGKFGQLRQAWEPTTNTMQFADGAYDGINADTGERIRFFVIAGQRFVCKERGEAFNSFPGIASTITSAARMLLWKYITMAGRNNVWYCDTDSILCTAAGSHRMLPMVNATQIGRLKLEGKTQRVEIYSPKDYIFGKRRRMKGIRNDAIPIDDLTFKTYRFVGLRGAIRAGTLNGQVQVFPVIKHLARLYRKGVVHSDGSVSPFSLSVE